MKIKHIHKYQKIKLGSNREVFKCMLPGCRHYIPEIELTLGNLTLCWGCEKEIIMTKEQMEKVKPICDECKKRKREKIEEDLLLPILPKEL